MSEDFDEYTPRGARERRLNDPRPKRTRKAVRAGESVVAARPRQMKSEMRKQIERGLNGDTAGSGISRAIGYVARNCSRKQVAVARGILYALERGEAMILTAPPAAVGVLRLARFHEQFVRDPHDFVPADDTPEEQLRLLAAHLCERWPVPYWLSSCWMQDEEPMQKWFVHLGGGGNLSEAPDLPYPLTRRMAHFAVEAPLRLEPLQALRWGQLRGLGIPEELCREIVHTRLALTLPDEPFWKTVGEWFAVYPEIFGNAGILVDFLFAQRIGDFAPPPHPGFSMTRRKPDRLLADARAWHETLMQHRRQLTVGPPRWQSCGIDGLRPDAPDAGANSAPAAAPSAAQSAPPSWQIMELLTAADLDFEGQQLHHCVASYALMAAQGNSAIFSLRRLVEGTSRPSVTIEVLPRQRTIAQVRGLQNSVANLDDRRLIETWAAMKGLSIQPLVFGADGRDRRRA